MLAMSCIPSSHMTIAKVFHTQVTHLTQLRLLSINSSMKHGLTVKIASRFAPSSTPLHQGLRSSREKISKAVASFQRTEQQSNSVHSGSAPRSRKRMATIWIRCQSSSNTKIAVCSMRTLKELSGTEQNTMKS